MNREFKRLVKDRVTLIAVIHDNNDSSLRAVTNHTKFAIFDGWKVLLLFSSELLSRDLNPY